MGKYIRKSKINGGESLSLMDVSPSSLGVLTRAKSLALQRRLQKPSSSSSSLPPPPPSSKRKQKQQTTTDCGGGSYLQLRSRRLQKKSPIVLIRSSKRRKGRRREDSCGVNPNPNPQKFDSLVDSIRGSGSKSKSDSIAESVVCGKHKESNNKTPCVETSFGENFFELQSSESFNRRATRESTPCSLIRQPEMITRSPREESLSGSHRHLPTTPEMNEFFSGAEEEQQKKFIEKYNFDPVNEQPLPGRYEWKKVDD